MELVAKSFNNHLKQNIKNVKINIYKLGNTWNINGTYFKVSLFFLLDILLSSIFLVNKAPQAVLVVWLNECTPNFIPIKNKAKVTLCTELMYFITDMLRLKKIKQLNYELSYSFEIGICQY